MSDYRKTEIERITNSDLAPEAKARLIKLVSMSHEEMKEYKAKRASFARSLNYAITLTGEELEQVNFAALLNRRMFDRGAEHETLDAAFSTVLKKCAAILDAEWQKETP